MCVCMSVCVCMWCVRVRVCVCVCVLNNFVTETNDNWKDFSCNRFVLISEEISATDITL